jgi:hypothetical protein
MFTASNTVEDSDDETPPKPSLGLRLKRLLVAPLLLLRRLRRTAPAEAAADDEASPVRGRGREWESEEAVAVPAGPPLWRRALPHAIVFALGAAAAGGAVSWLAGQVIARQSALIAEQETDIARLRGVLAGYDRMMLQSRKKLEEEQGRRAEAENRLAMAQTDLARRAAPRETAAGPGPGGTRAAARPADPGRTGDCTLRPGTAGSTLKGCLEEFNR